MTTKIITYNKDLTKEQVNDIENIFKTCFPKDKIILVKEGMIKDIKEYCFYDYSSCLTTTALNNCNNYTATSEIAKTEDNTWKDRFVYNIT